MSRDSSACLLIVRHVCSRRGPGFESQICQPHAATRPLGFGILRGFCPNPDHKMVFAVVLHSTAAEGGMKLTSRCLVHLLILDSTSGTHEASEPEPLNQSQTMHPETGALSIDFA